jgi:tellurite resistance-related uncharacterized protein
MSEAPYKVTPEFDETSLPEGLRRIHTTKAGCWGLIRLSEGRLLLSFPGTGRETVLSPEAPGLVAPGEPHLVAPLGRFRMRVEFYRSPPPASAAARSAPA